MKCSKRLLAIVAFSFVSFCVWMVVFNGRRFHNGDYIAAGELRTPRTSVSAGSGDDLQSDPLFIEDPLTRPPTIASTAPPTLPPTPSPTPPPTLPASREGFCPPPDHPDPHSGIVQCPLASSGRWLALPSLCKLLSPICISAHHLLGSSELPPVSLADRILVEQAYATLSFCNHGVFIGPLSTWTLFLGLMTRTRQADLRIVAEHGTPLFGWLTNMHFVTPSAAATVFRTRNIMVWFDQSTRNADVVRWVPELATDSDTFLIVPSSRTNHSDFNRYTWIIVCLLAFLAPFDCCGSNNSPYAERNSS
jgi:hypothetical protein